MAHEKGFHTYRWGTTTAAEVSAHMGLPQAGFPGGCARDRGYQDGNPELRGGHQEQLQSDPGRLAWLPPGTAGTTVGSSLCLVHRALHPQLPWPPAAAPDRPCLLAGGFLYVHRGLTSQRPVELRHQAPRMLPHKPHPIRAPEVAPVACLPLLLDGDALLLQSFFVGHLQELNLLPREEADGKRLLQQFLGRYGLGDVPDEGADVLLHIV